MGVRPLERAWRRIAVHPQPGSTLDHATMTVPTLRGEIQLSFARTTGQFTTGEFALNVTVPGSTSAEVCLPVGLLSGSPHVTLGGVAVATRVPAGRAGQLCLAKDLVGGRHIIVAQ